MLVLVFVCLAFVSRNIALIVREHTIQPKLYWFDSVDCSLPHCTGLSSTPHKSASQPPTPPCAGCVPVRTVFPFAGVSVHAVPFLVVLTWVILKSFLLTPVQCLSVSALKPAPAASEHVLSPFVCVHAPPCVPMRLISRPCGSMRTHVSFSGTHDSFHKMFISSVVVSCGPLWSAVDLWSIVACCGTWVSQNTALAAQAPNIGLSCMKKDRIDVLRHENGYTWR